MVKNSTGGNKSRQQGRRFGGGGGGSGGGASVRKVKEEGEMYGAITRINGGRYCQVTCTDGVSRICTIRKKFASQRRGDNILAVGVWVLVGVYEWQSSSPACDLLEIYSNQERDQLKQVENKYDFSCLIAVGDSNIVGGEVSFSQFRNTRPLDIDNAEDEDEGPAPQEKSRGAAFIATVDQEPKKTTTVHEELDWINVDDV